MKKIVILIDNIERANFYANFISGCLSFSYSIVTNRPSVYLYINHKLIDSNNDNVEVLLLSPSKVTKNFIKSPHLFNRCVHVVRGSQTKEKAAQVYTQAFENLQRIFLERRDIYLALAFNGNYALTMAFSDFFENQNIDVMYSEISNLPGKVIFDPCGVNAQSLLFSTPEYLDNLKEVSEEEHLSWLKQYEEYKATPIPQSKINVLSYASNLLDQIGWSLKFGFNVDSDGLYGKIKKFFLINQARKFISNLPDTDDCLVGQYVFFPTQVKSDSQLIVNSDIDNIGALKFAIELARKKGLNLIVKVHPAEKDPSIISEYISLRAKYGFIIVNSNTTELIKGASSIVTINSTVGLESLMYGKKVHVLGRAIYSSFCYERTKKYIHRYLVNFDYYGVDPIKPLEVDKVIVIKNILRTD